MKKFFKITLLILLVHIILFYPSNALADSSTSEGIVIINNSWSDDGKTLQHAIEELPDITSVSDVTSLTITSTVADTLTNKDMDYIGAMSNLTVLDVNNNVSVEDQYHGYLNGLGKLTTLSFPATYFGGFANNCQNLKTVNLPNAKLLDDSFANCTSLTSITLPKLRSTEGCFSGCTNLKEITLPTIEYFTTFSDTDPGYDPTFNGIPSKITMNLPGNIFPDVRSGYFDGYNPKSKGAIVNVPTGTGEAYDSFDGINDNMWYGWTINETGSYKQVHIVTFDSKGGGEVSPQFVMHESKISFAYPTKKEGYTHAGWFKEEAYINPWDFDTDIVTEDITLYFKWISEDPNKQFTITFNSQGGTAVDSQTILSGSNAAEPNAPAKDSFDFGGWYKESSCINKWNFAVDTVTTDIMLYAKWTSTTPPSYTPTITGYDYTMYFNTMTAMLFLYWDEVEGAEEYLVEYAGAYEDIPDYNRIGSSQVVNTTARIASISADNDYVFRVAAVVDGEKYWTNSYLIEWENDINLQAPANFIVTDADQSSISLSWDAVSGADGYEIKWQAEGAVVKYFTTSNVTHTFESLDSDTNYTFTVGAVKNCDNGRVVVYSENAVTQKTKYYWRINYYHNDYIVTKKPKANVWTEPTSKYGTLKGTVAEGTIIHVVETYKNSSGSIWYKMDDGWFIYSGNAEKAEETDQNDNNQEKYWETKTVNSVYMVDKIPNANIWSEPTSDSVLLDTMSFGSSVKVVAHYENHKGSIWYKLDDGRYIYSKNVKLVIENAECTTTIGADRKYTNHEYTINTTSDINEIETYFKYGVSNLEAEINDNKITFKQDGDCLLETYLVLGTSKVILDSINLKIYKDVIIPYNDMTLINQDDYGDKTMKGSSTIESAGCGYASLTMVINSIKDENILITELYENYSNYYVAGKGMSWGAIDDILDDYNIGNMRLVDQNYSEGQTGEDKAEIVNTLLDGKILVCLTKGSSKPGSAGKFTSGGHYIVVNGYRVVNGKEEVLVFDPNGSNYNSTDRLAKFDKHKTGARWVDLRYIYSDSFIVWKVDN